MTKEKEIILKACNHIDIAIESLKSAIKEMDKILMDNIPDIEPNPNLKKLIEFFEDEE